MILHKYIRQQSTRVKVRISTTFRQSRKIAIKKSHTKNINNVYILIARYRFVQFVKSHKHKIYMHFVLIFKIMCLNAWRLSVRPKHVARTDKTNIICCVWEQHICKSVLIFKLLYSAAYLYSITVSFHRSFSSGLLTSYTRQ